MILLIFSQMLHFKLMKMVFFVVVVVEGLFWSLENYPVDVTNCRINLFWDIG